MDFSCDQPCEGICAGAGIFESSSQLRFLSGVEGPVLLRTYFCFWFKVMKADVLNETNKREKMNSAEGTFRAGAGNLHFLRFSYW